MMTYDEAADGEVYGDGFGEPEEERGIRWYIEAYLQPLLLNIISSVVFGYNPLSHSYIMCQKYSQSQNLVMLQD